VRLRQWQELWTSRGVSPADLGKTELREDFFFCSEPAGEKYQGYWLCSRHMDSELMGEEVRRGISREDK
jgi:hypothetical protein